MSEAQGRLDKIAALLGELDLNGATTREGTAWGTVLRESLALARHQPRVLLVDVPRVPYGPAGLSETQADADYYRAAARNIRHQAERGNPFAGSNVTEAVARLCENVATALNEKAQENHGPQ